jgi:cobalt-zinc-cadmium efflux system outer membrane protein
MTGRPPSFARRAECARRGGHGATSGEEQSRWKRVAIAGAIVAGLCTLCLTVHTSGAQERLTQLSLDDAVRLALQRNATLRAKEREYEATRANEITAGLRPNPTASYAAEQLGGGAASQEQHTVIVGQTIETGGKRQRRIDSARAATRVSSFEVADVRRQTVATVKKSFTDILVAQAILELTQANLKTLDELERVQRFRAERGDISELELTRIQVQRFAFERDAADAAQASRTAKIALRAAVGPEAIAADFSVTGTLEFRDVIVDRANSQRRALANRPDLLASEAGRDKARADYNLARANASWDFTPQLEYQRIGPDNTLGFGVSLPIRIFDRNQGEIARTNAATGQATALRDAAVIQVLSDVDTALSTLATEREKVRALRQIYLPKAQQARDTVEFAYRRGGLSLLDFLDAERTYRDTALEHIRALGNYGAALVQLETAVGAPVESRP